MALCTQLNIHNFFSPRSFDGMASARLVSFAPDGFLMACFQTDISVYSIGF